MPKMAIRFLLIFLPGLIFSHIFSVTAYANSAADVNPVESMLLALPITPQAAQTGLAELEMSLRATLKNNPAIKGKLAELEAQGYAVDSAKALRLPSFVAQANTLDNEQGQGTLRVSQPLWAFGKIDAEIAREKEGVSVEEKALLQVQRQLIESTAVSYANIIAIKQRQVVAQANVVEHQSLYERIERRQKGLLAAESDVRLAYSRLLQAKTQRQRIDGELHIALAELEALTQKEIIPTQLLSSSILELPASSVVRQLALSEHADIQVKRQQVLLLESGVEKEKLAITPTVFLQVEHDILNRDLNRDETRIGIAVESRFEGLGMVSRGRIKAVTARLNAAQFDYDNVLVDTRRSIDTLLLNRRLQQDLLGAQAETVAAVGETMASFIRQYNSGKKSWVDVLNTQRELTELRLQLVQTQAEWQMLSLRLAVKIGLLDSLAGLSQSPS